MRAAIPIAVLGGVALLSAGLGYWAATTGRSAEPVDRAADGAARGVSMESLLADSAPAVGSEELRSVMETGRAAIRAGDLEAAFASLGGIDEEFREQATLELIGHLDAEQIAELFDKLDAGEIGFGGEGMYDGMVLIFALVDRWVELDSAAASAFAVRAVRDGSGEEGLMAVLTTAFLAQRDLEAARALFESLKRANPDVEDEFGEVIYVGVAFDDPVRALRLAREDGRGLDDSLDTIFEVVGPRAGEALGELLAFPPGGERTELMEALFEAWAKGDPHAALAAAADLPEAEEGREGFVADVLKRLAVHDPEAALDSIGLLPEDGRRSALRRVVERWAERDSQAALSWARDNLDAAALNDALEACEEHVDPAFGVELLAGFSPEARARFLAASDFADEGHFVQRLAAVDAGAAVDFLVDNNLLEMRPAGAEQDPFADNKSASSAERIARSAAMQDPAAAIALAASLPGGDFRDGFVRGLARQFGRDDPAAAADWAVGLDAGERGPATAALLRGWSSADPQGAANWASEQGGEAMQIAVRDWGQGDPEGAYRWLVGQMGEQPDELSALLDASSLLGDWAAKDPASAAEATMGFPEDLAPGKMGVVAARWAREEPDAVSAFINERLEPGAVRDAAVVALVERIKEDDPNGAAAWARSLSDEAKMYSVLDSLATR